MLQIRASPAMLPFATGKRAGELIDSTCSRACGFMAYAFYILYIRLCPANAAIPSAMTQLCKPVIFRNTTLATQVITRFNFLIFNYSLLFIHAVL